ncbi:unnamed protein product [Sphagnum balticum]
MFELAEALDIPLPYAAGLMQFLWEWTAERCPRGDIGKYSNKRIAEALRWPNADQLINALISTKWVDENLEHRLVIHDWPHHCEDSVHIGLARQLLCFADGTLPKTSRLSKQEREDLEASAQKRTKALPSALPSPSTVAFNQASTTTKPLPSASWPDSVKAIQSHFPGTDEAFCDRIIDAAVAVGAELSDLHLSRAIQRTYRKSQDSAALWLKTLPNYLATKPDLSGNTIPIRGPSNADTMDLALSKLIGGNA